MCKGRGVFPSFLAETMQAGCKKGLSRIRVARSGAKDCKDRELVKIRVPQVGVVVNKVLCCRTDLKGP